MRQKAQEFNLPNKERKDSQGICFLGKLKFSDFVSHHIPDKEGPLIEYETSKQLGTHKGFWYYTIGQRQGIGLAGGPWYVVAKKPEKNTVYISRAYYTEDKVRDTFKIRDCNWLASRPTSGEYLIKLRHGPTNHRGAITQNEDNTYTIKLFERDQGIAEGQFAVIYDGTQCLGSGVISHDVTGQPK